MTFEQHIAEEVRLIRGIIDGGNYSHNKGNEAFDHGFAEGKIRAAIYLLNALEDELPAVSSKETADDVDDNKQMEVF